jgi:hypothetical protein
MKKTIAAFAFALFATACGHKGDDKIKEFEGYKDKMCKCGTDAACGAKVLADWRDWRKGTVNMKPTDDQKKKIKEIDAAFHDCERKSGADGAETTP